LTISSTPHFASPSYRIEVSSSLSPFEQWWPVTSELGDARCYPFQCADVIRVWCDTSAAPAMSSLLLAYFDTMRQARGTTDLIQAQRDFFGAHGFERVDGGAGHHGPWGSGLAH
jgi:hypothetical protein